MRAFDVPRFGESPAIQDLPIPTDSGAILIKVASAGINPVDYKTVDQLSPKSTYPFVLGFDFAGIVEKVPEGESRFHIGDRVFGTARAHGSYADYTSVALSEKNEPIAPIPDGMTFEQAAALPIPAIAALGSLDLLGLVAGQWLVVIGANGAVGGFAVQAAHSRGIHVIAIVRGNPDESRKLGAEEVYDTKESDPFQAIRATHPDLVDGVLDIVSTKDTIHRNVEIIKPGGSIVSTVHTADVDWFAVRQIKAFNVNGATNPWATQQGLSDIANMAVNGTITPRIGSVIDLKEAGETIQKLRNGKIHGKVVVRL